MQLFQKTFRSKKYLDYIRGLPCVMITSPDPGSCMGSSEQNSHAHHESAGSGQNMQGGKAPDTMTVPLCWVCHNEREHKGLRFYTDHGVDTNWVLLKIINYLTGYLRG